jgi:hypothetical protein
VQANSTTVLRSVAWMRALSKRFGDSLLGRPSATLLLVGSDGVAPCDSTGYLTRNTFRLGEAKSDQFTHTALLAATGRKVAQ